MNYCNCPNCRTKNCPAGVLSICDRSEAVNLATNIRETDDIETITRRGILTLVEGVLKMDNYIKGLK